MNKSLLLVLFLVLLPFTGFAANFERDLYFGLKNDNDVKKLQEFLKDKGFYSGSITGGFFSLTRAALISFQEKEKVTPALGYFGQKTKARVNSILAPVLTPITPEPQEGKASVLKKQIEALTAQLQALQVRLAQEKVSIPKMEDKKVEVVPPKNEPDQNLVSVSGENTQPFPDVVSTLLKLGEFRVYNGTSTGILFSNFEIEIADEMDSTFNRGRRVFLILRDGKTALDDLVSRTAFTFVSTAPKVEEPYRSRVTLAYPLLVKSKEEKTVSLWVEQLEFVKSGKLEIKLVKANATSPLNGIGSFKFLLTKESSL